MAWKHGPLGPYLGALDPWLGSLGPQGFGLTEWRLGPMRPWLGVSKPLQAYAPYVPYYKLRSQDPGNTPAQDQWAKANLPAKL